MERKARTWIAWRMAHGKALTDAFDRNDPWLGSFVNTGGDRSDPPCDYTLTFDGPVMGKSAASNQRMMSALLNHRPISSSETGMITSVGRVTTNPGEFVSYQARVAFRDGGVSGFFYFHVTPPIQLFCVSGDARGRLSTAPGTHYAADYLTWFLPELWQKKRMWLAGSPRSDRPYLYPVDPAKLAPDPMWDRVAVALDSILETGRPDPRFLTVSD